MCFVAAFQKKKKKLPQIVIASFWAHFVYSGLGEALKGARRPDFKAHDRAPDNSHDKVEAHCELERSKLRSVY